MINEIVESNVLPECVENQLAPLQDELKATLDSVQRFRTRTEMEISVLEHLKHPTSASKYWQAVREQAVMYEELVRLSFEFRKNKVRRKKLEVKIGHTRNNLQREMYMIKAEELDWIMNQQQRTAEARLVEIKHWSKLKSRYWDDMNTFERKNPNNHQLLSYTRRWIHQYMAMGQNGSPAERYNLMGQLKTGLTMCRELHVLDRVLEGLPVEVVTFINTQVLLPEG